MYAQKYFMFPDVNHFYHPYDYCRYVYELQRKSGPSKPIQGEFSKDLNSSY